MPHKSDSTHFLPDSTGTVLSWIVNIVVLLILAYLSLIGYSNAVIAEYILGIIAALSLIGVFLFIPFCRKNLKQFESIREIVLYSKNKHISVDKFEKTLVLTDALLSDDPVRGGTCKFTHTVCLVNHSPQYDYRRYNYQIISHEDISNPDDYAIFIDNKRIHAKELVLDKYRTIHQDSPESTEYGCKMEIPLNVKHNQPVNLSIVEDYCPSFRKLRDFDGGNVAGLELISTRINYPTKELNVTVSLDKSIAGYALIRGMEPDREKKVVLYKVTDYSEQRIISHEKELEAWSAVPKFSQDSRTLSWTVREPIIGYRYTLYFTIEKTQKKGLRRQNTP